ncbi:MAG TPA: TonB family protein [Chitinophagaceae bacterium]|nr:TonB family protein [Chitinophagaceae bacterium]
MDINKILKSDYLDILYDGRNKEYGGYPLRKNYRRRTILAGLISGGLAILIILISLIEPKEEVVEEKEFVIDNVEIMDAPPLDQDEPPPPPPAATPPPPVKPTIKFTPPVVKENDQVREEDIPDQPDPGDNVEVGKITLEGSDSPDAISPNLATNSGDGRGQATQPAGEQKEEIFRHVEIMPEFPGGEAAMYRYIQRNVKYPTEARRNQIEGTVYVEFVVKPDGSISNVRAIRGPGGGLQEEAVRVVKSMPSWKPGRQNNRAVSVLFSIPINFTLQ